MRPEVGIGKRKKFACVPGHSHHLLVRVFKSRYHVNPSGVRSDTLVSAWRLQNSELSRHEDGLISSIRSKPVKPLTISDGQSVPEYSRQTPTYIRT